MATISLESFPPRGGPIHPAHLLGERLLANELDNLEKRYAKLVKMMRRLAFMVERDSPATFREFMGKPEPMSLKEQDEARQADQQMLAPTLSPPPAAGFEMLASRPSYDASARHEGIIFGGPLGGGPLRVDKVDGVHLWDLCGGCALAYVEGDTPAPKLGREYTVAVWVLWRPGAAEDEARALLCGEGGDDWLVAVGDDLGSATGRGDGLGFEPFATNVGLEASVGEGGEGWQLVVVTGRGATDGARSGESTLWVGTPSRPPAVAGRANRVWCGERLSSIGRPAERAGWVGAVMVWGRALPEVELASLHAASRRPYAMVGQHRAASGGDGGAGSSATAAAAAAMRAREREWAAKREKAAEEAKAREARREAQQAVVRRHAAEAKEVRGYAEGTRQQQAEEEARERERLQAQKEQARMAAALRRGEQADAAREAREARWSEAARRRVDADRQKLAQAAQLAAAASLIQRRQRERRSARETWKAAREMSAREGGARRRDDVAARQAARDKELKELAAARIQRQRSAQARGADAARELAARRKKAADATRAELAMHESEAAALRRERQLEAALRIQHDQRERAERAAEREADAAAMRRRQLAENARRKKELASARELGRGGIGSAGRQLTAPPPAPLRLRNEDGVVYKVI